ncbi:MAG: hypothetical protein KW793_04080 [Candidatus Doudnabacteria bacterium]|nr:hypothetical protein [Candidatus Doudnabacteria bacterium]
MHELIKPDEEYELGENCIWMEDGCVLLVRVVGKRYDAEMMIFELHVRNRISPSYLGLYPDNTIPGERFTVSKRIDCRITALWMLYPEEMYRLLGPKH